jgi:hypothetical protein
MSKLALLIIFATPSVFAGYCNVYLTPRQGEVFYNNDQRSAEVTSEKECSDFAQSLADGTYSTLKGQSKEVKAEYRFTTTGTKIAH